MLFFYLLRSVFDISGKTQSGKDDFSTGKIEAVVRKRDVEKGEIHFKLTNSNNQSCYALCSTVMSLNKKNIYQVIVIAIDLQLMVNTFL